MKLKRLLPVFGLVAMLGLGVGVGLASTQKPVKEAEAASVNPNSVNGTFLFTNSNNWGKVYAYAYNSDSDKYNDQPWPGVEMTYSYTNEFSQGVYEIDLPTGTFEHIIFNNGYSGDGNQSPTFDMRVNCAWSPSGAWNPHIGTKSTFRLWFYRNGHYGDGYNWKIWNGVADSTVYEPSYLKINDDNTYFLYYDLPVSLIGRQVSFQVFDNYSNYQIGIDYTITGTSCSKVLYADNGSGWSIKSYSSLADWHIYPATLSTVLYSYLSCSSNTQNGYGDFAQVYKTWVYDSAAGKSCLKDAATEDAAKNSLKTVTLTDYVEGDHNYAIETQKTDSTVTAYNKINQMLRSYTNANARIVPINSDTTSSSGSMVAIVSASAVSLAAVGGYFFIRKRKEF